MSPERRGRGRGRGRVGLGVVLAAVGAASLLVAGIVGVAALAFSPPQGPPLAVAEIEHDRHFELAVPSNGKPLRIWLDMRCEDCGFPVEGAVELSSAGELFQKMEISAGDSRDRAWGGHGRSLEQHLLFDTKPRPAGETIVVRGKLTVRGARGLTGAPMEDAPPPVLRLFRVSVTN